VGLIYKNKLETILFVTFNGWTSGVPTFEQTPPAYRSANGWHNYSGCYTIA